MVRISSFGLLASVIISARAQTSTLCNPLKQTCPSDPSLPATFNTDFTTANSIPSGWTLTGTGSASYSSAGAGLILGKEGDNPTLESNAYFLFGSFEVTLKAAPGQGVVTSAILLSDDLDEVDWEWIGGNTGQVQSNYFGKGDATTYDRAAWHNVASPQTTSHTYKIDWTPAAITFSIDGAVVRTLTYAAAQGGARFPQTPMKVRIGIWAGGDPSNGPGTVEWAGGLTDFSKVPYTMYVQSVKVTNYSPGTSYTYGDNSGSYQSIKIAGGSLMVANAVSVSSATSASSMTTSLSLASNVPTVNPIGVAGRNGTSNVTTTSASSAGSGSPSTTGSSSSSSSSAKASSAASHVAGIGSIGALFAVIMALLA